MAKKKVISMKFLILNQKAAKLDREDFLRFISSHPFLFVNKIYAEKFIRLYLISNKHFSAIETYTKQPYHKLFGHELGHGQGDVEQPANLSNFLELITQPASNPPVLCYYFLYSLGRKDKFLSYLLHATHNVDNTDHNKSLKSHLKSQLEEVIKENGRPDELKNLSIAAKVLLWKRSGDEIMNTRGYTRSAVQAYNSLLDEKEDEVKYSSYRAFEN